MAKKQLSPKYQVWIDARKRFHLSHAHIQMARELGMNPKKLGRKANHRQEPWKAPLPEFIEQLYIKRFGKRPDHVRSIEQIVQDKKRKQRNVRHESLRRGAIVKHRPHLESVYIGVRHPWYAPAAAAMRIQLAARRNSDASLVS